jgi:collagenase-like PrtC family protease
LLQLNGIQTLSALACNLLSELPALADAGADVLRISPQPQHTETVCSAFKEALTDGSVAALSFLAAQGYSNGYWHGDAGKELKPPV